MEHICKTAASGLSEFDCIYYESWDDNHCYYMTSQVLSKG